MVMNAVSRTEPNSATRPTSFLPRSTSIRCSARSLGSAAELGRERRVLLRMGAARARAGDRPQRHLAVFYPDQDLGRAPDDVDVVAMEVVEVRCGIEGAKVPVGEKRVRRRHLEPARQHGLKGVAGRDVLLDAAHVRLERSSAYGDTAGGSDGGGSSASGWIVPGTASRSTQSSIRAVAEA